MQMQNWIILLPTGVLTLGGIFNLLWEITFSTKGRKFLVPLNILFVLGSFVSIVYIFCFVCFNEQVSYTQAIGMNTISLLFQSIIILSVLLAVLFSGSYLQREKAVTGEYYFLMLTAAVGGMLLVMAQDFIVFFVAIELLSLPSYVLAGYFRVQERSLEAALKYYFLGIFASAFLLYGIALLYGFSNTTIIKDVFMNIPDGSKITASLALLLILVGFGFKIGAVPFHAWAPDVYDGSIAPVSSFLSTGVKAAGIAGFYQIASTIIDESQVYHSAVVLIAILTMFVGNFAALAQKSVKRLLAYSSVSHVGYVLIAFASLNAENSNETSFALAFYVLAYTLMTGGAFGMIAWVGGMGEKKTHLDDFKGLGSRNPLFALGFAVFLFSLAGIPPFAGFFGKYYIFNLAIQTNQVWLALLGILNSFVSAYYYLRVVVLMFMSGEESTEIEKSPFAYKMAVVICVIGTFVVGFLVQQGMFI